MMLTSQGSSDGEFSQFVENSRWVYRDVVFATVHLVGSWNGLRIDSVSVEESAAEVSLRTRAAALWTEASFDLAARIDAKAVVISFHANPSFEAAVENEYRRSYEPFLQSLEKYEDGSSPNWEYENS